MASSPQTREGDPELFAATGSEGVDEILSGGLSRDRLYLVEGVPGSGKTTLAMKFLLEGARRGEPVLYVTLSESAEELHAVAASHGWSLEGITLRELVPSEESLRPDDQYTMFHPSEVELGETTRTILEEVERIKPTRAVSIRSRSCGCSPALRSVTGGRSSRSSISSAAGTAPSCCSTT